MSALSIQVPFPVFQDRDGQPLDNGYVWLGTSSLNPQTNPVVAYYDSALTIVATQPLRTLNGFISRAGSPAQVYVDAVNFSILVQDRQGTTVFSVPEGTGISPNASGVVYDPAGTGAVATTVQAKLRESVSAKDFGATGNGATPDNAAIQLALDTGKSVFLPNGTYLLSAPITINTVGQRLYGESSQNTYLTGGITHDQVRVAASHCEVDHIHFRPGGYSDTSAPAFAPLRVYAALCHIHDNRFLANSSGHGTAIFLDDVNPATAAIVSGAYIHTIENNRIGANGYDFKYSIYCLNANNGQQATKFINNQIIGDVGIYVYKGGGNYYAGNLLQSTSGGVGVGNGIDLDVNVTGETITGNYIERYQYGVITRRTTNDYIVANIFGNHWDNNTTNYYSITSVFNRFVNDTTLAITTNGWEENFSDVDTFKFKNSAGNDVYYVSRAAKSVEPCVLAHTTRQSLSFTANAATQTPVSSWCDITGAGAARTGCFLGNGTRTGQHLYIRAQTWAVEILNNPGGTQNITFAGNAASATFGQAGNVGQMHLMWDASYSTGRWFEMSRTLA